MTAYQGRMAGPRALEGRIVKRLRNILIVAAVFIAVFAAIVFAPAPVAFILWLAVLFVLIGSLIRLRTLWSAR